MDQIVKQDSPSHPSRMRDKARQLLQDIEVERLPTLPNILLSLIKIENDSVNAHEQLANHIDKDPALRLRLLSICQLNTGITDSGKTTAEILQKVDNHTLRNLTITATTQQYFSEQATPEQTRFLKQHWQHALLCASIAKAIAKKSQYQYPEEAYTAGLLHDIGQLILHCTYPNIYTTLNTHNDNELALHDLEKNEFLCNHSYLGAELLKLYNVDSFISDSVLYHHEPIERILDAHPLVKIIHLANQLTNTDFDHSDNAIFDHANQLFGFDRSTIIEILSEANKYLNYSAVEFEIDLDDDNDDEVNLQNIQSRAEYVQTQLNEQIKYISLLDGLHQQLSRVNDDNERLTSIEKYSTLLFGVDHNIIFLYDSDKKLIRASASKGNQHLSDLTIPLKENRSIVTDCLLKKKALHSFSHQYNELNIVDQQLLSVSATQGMICLPMTSHQEIIGVLVLGVDRQQQTTLWKQLPLLQYFCHEIAHTIYCHRSGNNMASKGWGEFETHIREVIHEINNPLSIINNYLEILSLKLDTENQAHTDIQTIKSEIYRVSDILKRLKTPKTSTGTATKFDLNALITELSQIFETSILDSNNIQLNLDLDPEITPLYCNANALKQIYTNLVKNAVEALPANGQIMVYTQGQVNVDGKTYIEISVADNGPGIRSEVLSQLFRPIQSEKGGSHSGIGLSIVKKLVAELDGSISCRSSSKGTNFQILLPVK